MKRYESTMTQVRGDEPIGSNQYVRAEDAAEAVQAATKCSSQKDFDTIKRLQTANADLYSALKGLVYYATAMENFMGVATPGKALTEARETL